MKKIIYYTCMIFLAIGIVSCGKITTKRKVVNEWRAISYYEQTIDGNSIKTSTNSDSPDTPNKLTIDKDGTWTWNKISTGSMSVFGGSVLVTNKTDLTQSGTWSFIGKMKGDDFKKNERLMFTILSESTISTNTQSGGSPVFSDTTTISSSLQTYLTGEKVVIFTVLKSTGNELQMKSESAHSNSSGGQISSKNISVSLEAID